MREKLYMKYLVLKMEDRLNTQKLFKELDGKGFVRPRIRHIAEIILNCLEKEK